MKVKLNKDERPNTANQSLDGVKKSKATQSYGGLYWSFKGNKKLLISCIKSRTQVNFCPKTNSSLCKLLFKV